LWRRSRFQTYIPVLRSRFQIEYLVASVAEDEHAVRLSLRQSEILEKLQSVTLDPELEKQKPPGW
jgi:glutamate--cysteine ligase catalytic subunit